MRNIYLEPSAGKTLIDLAKDKLQEINPSGGTLRVDDKGDNVTRVYNQLDDSIYIYAPALQEEQQGMVAYSRGAAVDWCNVIRPYRGEPRMMILVAFTGFAPVFKPLTPLRLEDVDTEAGYSTLLEFIGAWMDRYNSEQYHDLKDTPTPPEYACTYYDGEETTTLKRPPYPYQLADATGVKINTPASYANALAKWYGVKKLDKDIEAAAKATYLQCQAAWYMCWVMYEFFRTEEYQTLLEGLKRYKEMGLPASWEKQAYWLTGKPAAADILAAYAGGLTRWMTGYINLRAVADYIGAPLEVLLQARVAGIDQHFTEMVY